MATNAILLTIGQYGDAPCYVSQLPLDDGADPRQIEKYVGSEEAKRHADRPPHKYVERYLDIDETIATGTRIYVFYLTALGLNEKPLLFPRSGSRFIFFPMGNHGSDRFLRERTEYGAGNRHLAAFECNFDGLWNSDLARLVRANGGDHNHSIRIPFYFNMVDEDLGAPPWVLPTHMKASRQPEHPGHHEHPHRDDHRAKEAEDTHGGVHPNPIAFFTAPSP